MSRKADCWDNAVAESLFHPLKTEWRNDTVYYTKDKTSADAVDYIEMFYNSHRLHSFIGYKNPNEFEKQSGLSEAA